MSKWYYCWECDDFFEEEEAGSRRAELEDSRPPDMMIMCCPCGSSEIEEAEVCKICGQPLKPTQDEICPSCEESLYKAVDALICDEVLTENFPGDYLDAKATFFEYLERRWF